MPRHPTCLPGCRHPHQTPVLRAGRQVALVAVGAMGLVVAGAAAAVAVAAARALESGAAEAVEEAMVEETAEAAVAMERNQAHRHGCIARVHATTRMAGVSGSRPLSRRNSRTPFHSGRYNRLVGPGCQHRFAPLIADHTRRTPADGVSVVVAAEVVVGVAVGVASRRGGGSGGGGGRGGMGGGKGGRGGEGEGVQVVLGPGSHFHACFSTTRSPSKA